MIRLALVLLLASCGLAVAQPQPRVTLDIAVPIPDGHIHMSWGNHKRLAIGPDGSLHALANSFLFDRENGSAPTRDARVELQAFAGDGRPRFRTTLPVALPPALSGFDMEALGFDVLASGDTMVFLSTGDSGQADRAYNRIYRVSPEGGVLRVTPVAPADGGDHRRIFWTQTYLATSDNGLLVAGAYGPGPLRWWLGKFDADGHRLWQAGPGPGAREQVATLAVRGDGTVVAVHSERRAGDAMEEWRIARFTAGGRLLDRTRLGNVGDGRLVAILPDSAVFLDAHELVQADDTGNVRRRVPWPYVRTWSLIADGDGISAIVCKQPEGDLCHIVRAKADGTILWLTPPLTATDIGRTPDGQIAAVVWRDEGRTMRLMRFASP